MEPYVRYSILERAALALGDDPLADGVRDLMDGVWHDLSEGTRDALSARADDELEYNVVISGLEFVDVEMMDVVTAIQACLPAGARILVERCTQTRTGHKPEGGDDE